VLYWPRCGMSQGTLPHAKRAAGLYAQIGYVDYAGRAEQLLAQIRAALR